jgi:UDP-N-acetyl-D-glucosamine/UDP-N-acetyl-D-galactosamine dehydrogenase
MNEVTQIFSKMDLSIWDVLAAANTKWNFLPFQPGLVGGHCIGVDPYYLSHRAQELGHDPKVILAGRSTNDGMGRWIADQIHARRSGSAASVLFLGLTFKENVPDLRNSKVVDVISHLQSLGHDVTVHDPLADAAEADHEYGIALDSQALERNYDVVVAAVAHDDYRAMDTDARNALVKDGGLIVDLKRIWPEHTASEGQKLWTL